ncbi:MAG: DUF3021 domain-containing protein [Butyrivibrio sp.]|nr:DUF3021 domain-containing protein [Butyrivibrio sp.]
MKAFLSELFKWFLIINTGIMVVVWLNTLGYEYIWTQIIPQIFCASFLTSLVTTIIFSINPRKPMGVPLRVLLVCVHYLILCAIIMTVGMLFDWFELTVKGGITVVLSVAAVYFLAAVTSYILSKGEADEMTNALKNYKDE